MFINLIILIVIIQILAVSSCRTVRIYSASAQIDYVLTQVPVDEQADSNLFIEFRDNGRPMYRYVANEGFENEEIYYLFHEKTSDSTGTGRWVFASYNPDSRRAFRKFHLRFHALVDSWAVLPQLIHEIADQRAPRSLWQIKNSTNQRWTTDSGLQVTCEASPKDNEGAEDSVFFFESSVYHQHHLSGFYVRRFLSPDHPAAVTTTSVYTKIKIYPEDLLFAMYDLVVDKNRDGTPLRHWLISSDGIGAEAGMVYVADNHLHADLIPDSAQWHFIGRDPQTQESRWLMDSTARVMSTRKYQAWKLRQLEDEDDETARSLREWRAFKHSEEDEDSYSEDQEASLTGISSPVTAKASPSIYRVLRDMRRLQPHPKNAMQQLLSNGVGLPRIGLGTGGISHEDIERIIAEALEMGYQLFDLVREYGNEHIFGHVASYNRYDKPDELRKFRQSIFYETKVWPTNLGFEPTIHEVLASLGDLRTNYIDLYLLHWPHCDPGTDWMHCQDTVDPQGTWQQSWKALEKLYAEGFLQAIGVSNFDEALLQQLQDKVGTILPHVVQNYASLEHVDMDVRLWCSVRGIAYQPYASIRNVRHLPTTKRQLLQTMLHSMDEKKTAQGLINDQTLLLRFFLETGACIIPRASQSKHLHANLQLWTWALTESQVVELGWDLEAFHSHHQSHVHGHGDDAAADGNLNNEDDDGEF